MTRPIPIYEASLATNGSTAWFPVTGPVWVSVSGTFASSTAVIQRKNAAGTAVTVTVPTTITQTAAYDAYLEFPDNAVNELRVTTSGATSTPAVAASFQDGGNQGPFAKNR